MPLDLKTAMSVGAARHVAAAVEELAPLVRLEPVEQLPRPGSIEVAGLLLQPRRASCSRRTTRAPSTALSSSRARGSSAPGRADECALENSSRRAAQDRCEVGRGHDDVLRGGLLGPTPAGSAPCAAQKAASSASGRAATSTPVDPGSASRRAAAICGRCRAGRGAIALEARGLGPRPGPARRAPAERAARASEAQRLAPRRPRPARPARARRRRAVEPGRTPEQGRRQPGEAALAMARWPATGEGALTELDATSAKVELATLEASAGPGRSSVSATTARASPGSSSAVTSAAASTSAPRGSGRGLPTPPHDRAPAVDQTPQPASQAVRGRSERASATSSGAAR